MVTISQHTQISNHHVVYLKLLIISVICQLCINKKEKAGNPDSTKNKCFWITETESKIGEGQNWNGAESWCSLPGHLPRSCLWSKIQRYLSRVRETKVKGIGEQRKFVLPWREETSCCRKKKDSLTRDKYKNSEQH